MQVHIALYKWKKDILDAEVKAVLGDVEALANEVPGIIAITTTKNRSKYSDGYTHVIFVQAEDEASIEVYRAHPHHIDVATRIEAIEDKGIGVDFSL